MPKLTRRSFAAAAICCAAVATMGMGGDGGPDADRNENQTVYQISLTDSDGANSTITKLFVLGDGRARIAKTRPGIARRNQARVDYSAIPVIGKLSEHRYDKEDFDASTEVGVVRVVGNKLALVLDLTAAPKPNEVLKIAVMNKDVVFETRRPLAQGDAQGHAGWDQQGKAVGTLHWRDDGVLMALIRPFTVTDSALW